MTTTTAPATNTATLDAALHAIQDHIAAARSRGGSATASSSNPAARANTPIRYVGA